MALKIDTLIDIKLLRWRLLRRVSELHVSLHDYDELVSLREELKNGARNALTGEHFEIRHARDVTPGWCRLVWSTSEREIFEIEALYEALRITPTERMLVEAQISRRYGATPT